MSPRSFLTIVVLVAVVLSSTAHAAGAADGDRCVHVRPSEPSIVALLRQGQAKSPLLQQLVDRLNASDVIVYLRINRELPAHVEGQLTFMAAGGDHRYVVVSLAPARAELRAMAVLGHELRHAVEVAEHAEIVDVNTFRLAYQRFGIKGPTTSRGMTFDTQAAIEAGDRVWLEVSRRRLVASNH